MQLRKTTTQGPDDLNVADCFGGYRSLIEADSILRTLTAAEAASGLSFRKCLYLFNDTDTEITNADIYLDSGFTPFTSDVSAAYTALFSVDRSDAEAASAPPHGCLFASSGECMSYTKEDLGGGDYRFHVLERGVLHTSPQPVTSGSTTLQFAPPLAVGTSVSRLTVTSPAGSPSGVAFSPVPNASNVLSVASIPAYSGVFLWFDGYLPAGSGEYITATDTLSLSLTVDHDASTDTFDCDVALNSAADAEVTPDSFAEVEEIASEFSVRLASDALDGADVNLLAFNAVPLDAAFHYSEDLRLYWNPDETADTSPPVYLPQFELVGGEFYTDLLTQGGLVFNIGGTDYVLQDGQPVVFPSIEPGSYVTFKIGVRGARAYFDESFALTVDLKANVPYSPDTYGTGLRYPRVFGGSRGLFEDTRPYYLSLFITQGAVPAARYCE